MINLVNYNKTFQFALQDFSYNRSLKACPKGVTQNRLCQHQTCRDNDKTMFALQNHNNNCYLAATDNKELAAKLCLILKLLIKKPR